MDGASCPDWVDQTYTDNKAAQVWEFGEPSVNVPTSGDNFELRDISGTQNSKETDNLIWSISDRANNRPDITSTQVVAGAAATGIASNFRLYAHDGADGSVEAMFDIDPNVLVTVDLEDIVLDTFDPDGAADVPDMEELAMDYRSGVDRLYLLDTGDDHANRGKPGEEYEDYPPYIYRIDEPPVTVDGTVSSGESSVLDATSNGLVRYEIEYYDSTDEATANRVYVNGEAAFFDGLDTDGDGPNGANRILYIMERGGKDFDIGTDGTTNDHRVFRISGWPSGGGVVRAEQVAIVDVPVTTGSSTNSRFTIFGADMLQNNKEWVVRNGERAFVWDRRHKLDGTWQNVGPTMNAYPLAEELPSATDQSCSSTAAEFNYVQTTVSTQPKDVEESIAYRYPDGGSAAGFYGAQDNTATPQLFKTDEP